MTSDNLAHDINSDANKSKFAGVRVMPKNDKEYERKRKAVVISLSPAQVDALDTAATDAGKNRSEFLRDVLQGIVPNWPDDLMAHGEALNKPPDC